MKCPKCGYTSYNHLENCKRCNAPLNPKAFYDHRIVNPESKSKESENPAVNKEFSEAGLLSEDFQPDDETDLFVNHDRFQDVFDKLEEVKTDDNDHSRDTLILENDYGIVDTVKDYIYRFVPGSNFAAEDKTVISYHLANIRSRFAAFLIDWTIVVTLSLVVFITGLRQIDMDYNYNPGALFSILVKVYFLLLFFASSYFLFLTAYGGKTIGKMILGIEVINKSGARPGYYDSTKRWFFSIFSLLPLFTGYMLAFFNEERQSLHDKIANTVVVNTTDTNDY